MVIESIHSFIHALVDFHRGNFTPTVIVWTVLGVLGGAFTLSNLKDAVRDNLAVAALSNPEDKRRQEDLKLIAWWQIVSETIRLSIFLTMITIGVIVALSTPVLTDAERKALHIPYWTPTGIALTLALLWISAGLVVKAFLDRRMRDHFYKRKD